MVVLRIELSMKFSMVKSVVEVVLVSRFFCCYIWFSLLSVWLKVGMMKCGMFSVGGRIFYRMIMLTRMRMVIS